MLRFAALMGLLAAPAAADVATVSGCEFEHFETRSFIECDLTNLSETAIASGNFELQIFQEGRTVPWVALGQVQSLGDIPGGVEPQETRSLLFWSGNLPDEADIDALRIVVRILRLVDINGSEISPN